MLLLCADARDGVGYSYDDVHAWDPADLQWFLDLGVMREGPRASEIYLWECDAQEVFEPQWFTHHATGERVGLCVCEACGTAHKVKPERMRTWISSFNQIAAALAQCVELHEEPVIMLHEHVARLGLIEHEKRGYEVFLVRGLRWRPGLIQDCARLRDTPGAVVLTLGGSTDAHTWPAGWHQVLQVGEHLKLDAGQLRLPVTLAPERVEQDAQTALTMQERDVLEALASRPDEPLLTVELEQAAGYGRHTIVDAVRRLEAMQLVERPGGGKRKGVAISHRGRVWFAQAGGKSGGRG